MNLKLYPLDRQKCSLRVASCKFCSNSKPFFTLTKRAFSLLFFIKTTTDGWTTDDLQYLWKDSEPVQIVKDLHLPRFTLERYISDYCNIETNTGNLTLRPKTHRAWMLQANTHRAWKRINRFRTVLASAYKTLQNADSFCFLNRFSSRRIQLLDCRLNV